MSAAPAALDQPPGPGALAALPVEDPLGWLAVSAMLLATAGVGGLVLGLAELLGVEVSLF